MSAYYGYPSSSSQLASYMAAAAAASQSSASSGATFHVAYPNQYMLNSNSLKAVPMVGASSSIKPHQNQGLYSNFVPAGQTQSVSANSYESALLSAATGQFSGASHRGNSSARPRWGGGTMKKQPATVAQSKVHYCEICKISCAGPQTWQEHISGSKHKKREASMKAGNDSSVPQLGRSGASFLKCAVCDISVTGSDAFVAHVNGAKHQKTIKVYQQMGKPVPSSEPIVISPAQAAQSNITVAEKKGALDKNILPRVSGTGNTVLGTAKVSFVAAGQLHTIKDDKNMEAPSEGDHSAQGPKVVGSPKASVQTLSAGGVLYLPNENNVAPVGSEYVEQAYAENGRLTYHCKLCDCSFNDPFAKEMHLKGRRHRLAYKQKVDPSLVVDVKSNSYKAKQLRSSKNGIGNRHLGSGLNYNPPSNYYSSANQKLPYRPNPQQDVGQSELDDRYVISKHSVVYASQMELEAIQKLVLRSECALKMTSDQLLEVEISKERERQTMSNPENMADFSAPSGWTPSAIQIQQMRHLRGVQRCGPLAKGLLIHGDTSVDLVVMCLAKPTNDMLEKVAATLPENIALAATKGSTEMKHLNKVELEDFQINSAPENGMILISAMAKFPPNEQDDESENCQPSQQRFECRVYLTSQAVSEDPADAATDPPNMLPRSCCLSALAKLRHAKFFQAKITPNQEAMIALRILRDLCRRVPTWGPFPQWALELLVEKCASTTSVQLSAAQLLRRVFECLAAGILLPGGPGIYDPCERNATDAALPLNEQQREDITASAQHALRLVAFGLIWKVLGIERINQYLSDESPRRTGTKRRAGDDSSPIGAKSLALEPKAMAQ